MPLPAATGLPLLSLPLNAPASRLVKLQDPGLPRAGFVPLTSSLRPDFVSRRERFWTLCPLGHPVATAY